MNCTRDRIALTRHIQPVSTSETWEIWTNLMNYTSINIRFWRCFAVITDITKGSWGKGHKICIISGNCFPCEFLTIPEIFSWDFETCSFYASFKGQNMSPLLQKASQELSSLTLCTVNLQQGYVTVSPLAKGMWAETRNPGIRTPHECERKKLSSHLRIIWLLFCATETPPWWDYFVTLITKRKKTIWVIFGLYLCVSHRACFGKHPTRLPTMDLPAAGCGTTLTGENQRLPSLLCHSCIPGPQWPL